MEGCAQVGDDDYRDVAMRECRAYIEAIRKKLGPEPEGATLRVKSFPHDHGTYYEAVCIYDPNESQAVEYAFRCEAEAPSTWDEVGIEPPQSGRGKGRG
jgi:hypothetical protein